MYALQTHANWWEKILAAKRSGIKEIILSSKNKRDIGEIEKTYIKGLTFHYVDTVDEVLKLALLKDKVTKPLEFVLPEVELKKSVVGNRQ